MRLPFILTLLLLASIVRAATLEEITQLVQDGHWQQARAEIAQELAATNLTFAAREDLLFQRDRIMRMHMDFSSTRAQIFREVHRLAPTLTEQQFATWENAGQVEYLDVDGTRWYFRAAARNLFRINAEARALLGKAGSDQLFGSPNYRLEDIHTILANYDKTSNITNTPQTWRISYQLSVTPDAVPAGETVRAWLPFPHAMNRQSGIRLVSSEPARSLLSSSNDAISTVYLEKRAVSGEPTVFQIMFEVTCRAFFEPIDPARVVPADPNDPALAPSLAEKPPHMVFSDDIKNISQQIIGTETNSYLKARRIFEWVSGHIAWASAREYCTLDCLPKYAIPHGHGDCGMETMTFMTLCRYNGIPAHWETGWVFGPSKDMHDWCEIYLAPYGWVPVDVTYGLINSAQDREKWFYLGGIDGYRFVVNNDFCQPLYPVKTHFRSEVVDFQRGEVEWRGGNLYYNQWTYDYNVEPVTAAQ